jgi:tRNA threonylcarbamoyladenosine biosynthesis protein TsaE
VKSSATSIEEQSVLGLLQSARLSHYDGNALKTAMPNDTSLTLTLATLEQTQALGRKLGSLLHAGTVLLLEGDLGTGKTSLVQGLGAGLGIADLIVSPTFALIHEYHEGHLPLYHFDLYRLSPAEVSELHLAIYWLGLEMPLGIMAIEWPDRLNPLPENHLKLRLAYAPEGRIATLTAAGTIPQWPQMTQNLAAEFVTQAKT